MIFQTFIESKTNTEVVRLAAVWLAAVRLAAQNIFWELNFQPVDEFDEKDVLCAEFFVTSLNIFIQFWFHHLLEKIL